MEVRQCVCEDGAWMGVGLGVVLSGSHGSSGDKGGFVLGLVLVPVLVLLLVRRLEMVWGIVVVKGRNWTVPLMVESKIS